MNAIFTDPKLKAAMLGKVRWITPQDNRLSFEQIQQWNIEHPETRMSIVNLQKEWRDIDDWSTPTFYFFENGRLISKMNGWPKAGNRENLIANLKRIGLWNEPQ